VNGGARTLIVREADAYHPFSVPGRAMIQPLQQMASTETTRMALMIRDWVESNTARRTADRE
jgi:hypothetical protein